MPREGSENTSVGTRRTTRTATPRKRVASPSRTVTARKAPTRSTSVGAHTSSAKLVIAVIAGYITVCGASVAIGMTDKGQIDVSATITQRTTTERRLAEERGEEYVPPQATAQTQARTPNGGLRPQGLVASPEPPSPPPTTTEGATSTEEAGDTDIVEDTGSEEVSSDETEVSDVENGEEITPVSEPTTDTPVTQ